MSENYIVINGKKAELTEEQMKQLGINVEEKKEFKQNAKQKDKNLNHIKESLEFYLDSHEENGVVYIPKFIVKKMIEELKDL